MFSRFSRRGLSLFLALVTLCICLSPALVQPAEAVVGIDDATIAVGLLFASWAGVTFMTNQGAYSAVSNFLSSSAAGLKACSDVAANYLVNGSLQLVQGVKDAFTSVLPDLNNTFRAPSSSDTGYLCGALPVNVPLTVPQFSDSPSFSDLIRYDGDVSAYSVSARGHTYSFQITTDDWFRVLDENGSCLCSYGWAYDSVFYGFTVFVFSGQL